MNLNFRAVRADEVDVRQARMIGNGERIQILFYKDARVDQNILDETVGAMNWQRAHTRDNANCIVSIWDDEKKQWVSKEDTGTESNTEAQKGLASDSFKRACFNWGIGRELYTAPKGSTIWATDKQGKPNYQVKNGKCYDRFSVSELTVKDGCIVHVVVVNDDLKGKVVYKWDRYTVKPEDAPKKAEEIVDAETRLKIMKNWNRLNPEKRKLVAQHYGFEKPDDITKEQAAAYIADLIRKEQCTQQES